MNVMKELIYLFNKGLVFFLLASAANSAENDSSVNLHTLSIEPRITYEQYKMPDNIQSLGVLGLHGLIDFTPWSYGGLGLYAAVKGENGGYFSFSL